tara:strand:- start:2314 stop:2514 length:201 start_codon:yes stop_codon:yes gene_type:complete
MGKHRPVNRLLRKQERGRGKAQVVETPKQLHHIMWVKYGARTAKKCRTALWVQLLRPAHPCQLALP